MDEKNPCRCRGLNKPRAAVCERCGDDFMAYSSRARFCTACRDQHRREHMREYHQTRRVEKPEAPPQPRFGDDGGVKCPFWRDTHPRQTIRCEGGRATRFPTQEEYRQYMACYCERNPEYQECPFAAELIAKYEEV